MSNVSMINGHIDNVLSDEDIVKALECCSNYDVDCDICPANGYCDKDAFCFTGVILDLINRLKADKEALIKGQETLMKCIAKKKETIAELDAEVEKLVFHNKELLKDIHRHHDFKIECIKRAKSEAIKKFAERLKKEATVDEDSTWWIANVDVDKLVTQMTEGDSYDKAFWEDTN